ncbi:hypothetical protein J4217_03645 [Candidatus Pacearchaeota archaeon]|nr:hypothetical protein [uncultured archaeon]MBS3091512.1 hypothetical protein [Candidatus Pacearchaeota archaeon]
MKEIVCPHCEEKSIKKDELRTTEKEEKSKDTDVRFVIIVLSSIMAFTE